ncbi:MAG: hypothetical protein Q4F24_16700, partial [Eubacteriales bacterium]|nr:hypothetical protein [Eubacteriales bacterium]
MAKNYPQYAKISTQNKINFVDGLLGEMSECLVYGLYVLFNSTLYDEYYRILNGSTQVNATEVNCTKSLARRLAPDTFFSLFHKKVAVF